MATAAIPAYGTLLKRGSSTSGASPQTYVTVGEVKSIKGPSREVSVIDVTTHSSAAAGAYREKIPSLIDAGDIEFDINYVPSDTTHQGLQADIGGRTKRDFQILTAANAAGASQSITFAGYVTAMPQEFPVDDVMSASITITITGAVTFGTPA